MKDSGKIEIDVQIENTVKNPITTFILEVELMNPNEVMHNFDLDIFKKGDDISIWCRKQRGRGSSKGKVRSHLGST